MMVLIAVNKQSINHWEDLFIPVVVTIVGLFLMLFIFLLYLQMNKIKHNRPESYNQDVEEITRL